MNMCVCVYVCGKSSPWVSKRMHIHERLRDNVASCISAEIVNSIFTNCIAVDRYSDNLYHLQLTVNYSAAGIIGFRPR